MTLDGISWTHKLTVVCVAASVLGLGCGGGTDAPPAVRLTDAFVANPDAGGSDAGSSAKPLALWGPDAMDLSQWKAVSGVSGLTVRDGKLVGRTTSETPLIYAPLPGGIDAADLPQSVEVRLSLTVGTNVEANLDTTAEPDVPRSVRAAAQGNFPFKTPIVASLGMQQLTMGFPAAGTLAGKTSLYLRPGDAADAEFVIESVRLLTRKEHLAKIPAGVTWQGVGEIYKESIITRPDAPASVKVSVPANAWLDLSLGTLEEGPVTFRLSAGPGGGSADGAKTILERTVTLPNRWEQAPADLSGLSGETEFYLTVSGAKQNVMGIWGNPVIRVRGARPPKVRSPEVSLGEPPRNVLLVYCDTLRRDHMDSYGYDRATGPTISALGAAGTVFTDNISPGSWTKVAAPSIFTSLFPTSHRVANVPDRLSAAAVTMAEVYREAGYATVGFSSVPFTGRLSNLHQGYEELHERTSYADPTSKTAREYVNRFLDWFEERPDTPYFALVHVFDPHSAYEAREPYTYLWADPAASDAHRKQIEASKSFIRDPEFQSRGLPFASELKQAGIDPEPFITYERDLYDGSIRGADAEIARLLERLRRNGSLQDTLVVFFSDHGEEFHDHGRTFHELSVYGELTNVPLMFHWPGVIPDGLRINETVRSVDIMPTVLDLSHLPIPDRAQGQSLVPLMAAAKRVGTEDRQALLNAAEQLGWSPKAAIAENVRTQGERLRATAFISDGWRFIHNTSNPYNDRPEFELCNHAEDPLCLNNVAGQHPDVVERLKTEMAVWRQEAESAKLPDADSTEGMADDELEKLRNLGYIQ